MKKIVALLIVVQMLLIAGCAQQKETTYQPDSESSAVEHTGINQYPDTWYDFSDEQPLLDDSGDAENYDIKKIFVANDENYIYAAFEVEGEKIDCTTMIHGGECVFVTIDMPGFFIVNNGDKKVYADNEGNGDYFGAADYKYEDGILQIRVPLSIFAGSEELIINTLFRDNSNGTKIEAGKCDDFIYFCSYVF